MNLHSHFSHHLRVTIRYSILTLYLITITYNLSMFDVYMKSILRFKGTITKDIEQSSIKSLLNTLYLCLTSENEELPQDDTWLYHLRGGKPSFILKHLKRQTQWIRRRSARLFFEMAQGRTKRIENRYIDLDVVRMEETS